MLSTTGPASFSGAFAAARLGCRSWMTQQPTGSLARMAAIRLACIHKAAYTTDHQPIRDPTYPFPLYFHLLPTDASSPLVSMSTPSHVRSSDSSKVQSNFALSFLPTFPRHNRQVIGYLSHGHGSGLVVPEGGLQVKPNKFTENEAFNTVLHSVIQQHLDKDPMVEAVLQQQLEGWTHITDYRNPPPYGRIPTPEDIFGSVQIVDGKFQNSSYQRMPSHRIVSSNGLFQLSDHLHEKLIQYLRNL